MKTVFLVLAGLCLSVFTAVAQNVNHPVIEKVQVMYKPDRALSSNGELSSTPNIKVNGTTHVRLKSGYDATKIYLKIKDKQTQATLYEVNYQIGSPDVTENNVILYRKQGDVLYLTNPAIVTLKPYVYELYTEDATGNKSSVYSIIQ